MNGQKDMEEKERRALGERIYDTVCCCFHPELFETSYLRTLLSFGNETSLFLST